MKSQVASSLVVSLGHTCNENMTIQTVMDAKNMNGNNNTTISSIEGESGSLRGPNRGGDKARETAMD